ncbi:phosphatidylglycerophosphatase A [Palleronia aestuarii]|uniref:Phosphatidylglycerophosphatase A n=1 Tax=Palleronia aestuarii TaxID=568105 RepID=A0A2W7NTL4_9RHOB|nr:phosphatidylglycerophosphatase A [Palleronia aestuarii]PZX19944.1 phosphatidylglycerophosphatase A [Palleronia aestuarii]
MTRLIATFLYVGLLRPGPGTWGSLAALPVGWLLHLAGGPWVLVAGIVAAFALGLWATRQETARTGVEDPGEIVIDEVAGQWIALLPLSFGAARVGVDILALWPGWIAAFVLFRLFDIYKVGPVGWADRRGDPLGVMLDDVIAGVFAALGVVALAALAHGLLI